METTLTPDEGARAERMWKNGVAAEAAIARVLAEREEAK